MSNAAYEQSETFIELEEKNFHNIPYTFLKNFEIVFA